MHSDGNVDLTLSYQVGRDGEARDMLTVRFAIAKYTLPNA